MASPAITYTFVSATTIRASEVNQNFTDIINGLTDTSKDLSVNKVTCATNFVTPLITGTTKLYGSLAIRAAAAPTSPDSMLHVFNGVVTGVTAVSGTNVTVESDTSGGGTGLNLLSFLSDGTTTSGLYCGVDADNDHGKFTYSPDGDWVFTVATKASAVIDRGGCLILNPGGTVTASIPAATYGIEIVSGAKSKIKVSPTSGAGFVEALGDPTDPIMNITGAATAGVLPCSTADSDASLYITALGATYRIPLYT